MVAPAFAVSLAPEVIVFHAFLGELRQRSDLNLFAALHFRPVAQPRPGYFHLLTYLDDGGVRDLVVYCDFSNRLAPDQFIKFLSLDEIGHLLPP